YNGRQFRAAALHFQSSSQLNPSGGGFPRYLARCYAATDQFDRAVREFEILLNRQPDNIETRIALALAQWKDGECLAAVATLREGVRRRSDSAELHYHLGVLLAGGDEF